MATTSRKIWQYEKEAVPIPGVQVEWISRKSSPTRWGNLILGAAIVVGTLVFCYVGYYFYQVP